jgi:7-carboxy-7-deazaguanine synthase
MSFEEIEKSISAFGTPHVLLTGGEPLLQHHSPAFVLYLSERGFRVSIETHGEVSIAAVAGKARIVMDIKTPGSGMCREGYVAHLPLLQPGDEIKFVLTSEADYEWARSRINDWLARKRIASGIEILISPAVTAQNQPGTFSPLSADWVAERILSDRLPVRFQFQLHKSIWGADRTGV